MAVTSAVFYQNTPILPNLVAVTFFPSQCLFPVPSALPNSLQREAFGDGQLERRGSSYCAQVVITGKPSSMLPSKAKTSGSIDVQMNLTEPSAMPKFAPPECSLPGDMK